MSPLNLRDELEDLARQVSPEVDALPADDPLKVWFEIELQEYISCTDDSQLNFEAANVRLHALKQLQYLVQRRRTLQDVQASIRLA